MLSKFLRAAAGVSKGVEYVGARTQAFDGTTSNVTVSLTSLTGGSSSSPIAGDFVLIYFATASTADSNLVVADYTEITETYVNDTFDTNLVVAYKFMPSTPDTSITLTGGTLNILDAGTVYVSVWRNVDTIQPFDALFTTANTANTVLANPPAITPFLEGAVIVAGGAGAHDDGVDTYSSSDLSDFRSIGRNDTNDSTIGGGYHVWTSGTFDPAAFTFSASNQTTFSSSAVTVALRKSRGVTPLSFVTSATASASSIVAPAGILAGDIIIFTNYAEDTASSIDPTDFISLVATGTLSHVVRTSYKVAVGTESGTTITGMTGINDLNIILTVFRLGQTPTVTTGTWNSRTRVENPPAQTVTSPADKPVIVYYATAIASSDPAPTFSVQTPLFDNEIVRGHVRVGFSRYMSNAPVTTADVSSLSNMALQSGYVALL